MWSGLVAAGLSPHPMLDVVWLGSGRPIAASYAGCSLAGYRQAYRRIL